MHERGEWIVLVVCAWEKECGPGGLIAYAPAEAGAGGPSPARDASPRGIWGTCSDGQRGEHLDHSTRAELLSSSAWSTQPTLGHWRHVTTGGGGDHGQHWLRPAAAGSTKYTDDAFEALVSALRREQGE